MQGGAARSNPLCGLCPSGKLADADPSSYGSNSCGGGRRVAPEPPARGRCRTRRGSGARLVRPRRSAPRRRTRRTAGDRGPLADPRSTVAIDGPGPGPVVVVTGRPWRPAGDRRRERVRTSIRGVLLLSSARACPYPFSPPALPLPWSGLSPRRLPEARPDREVQGRVAEGAGRQTCVRILGSVPRAHARAAPGVHERNGGPASGRRVRPGSRELPCCARSRVVTAAS